MPDIGISWKGIDFNNSADDNCILEYCLVTGSIDRGIECDNCNPILRYCTLSENSTDVNGGGIYCNGSNASIVNCTISGNTAIQDGGGIYIDQGSNPIIVNSIIEGNSGNGGIYFNNATFTDSIYYCDFFNNQGNDFAGNTPTGLGLIITTNANGDSCDPFFNIYLDPRFINPLENNFQLGGGSPCIDAGDPNSPFDPDGTIADIGAYYFDQSSGVETQPILQPYTFSLSNYPNPFNSSANISFNVLTSGMVRLSVYNEQGAEVAVIMDSYCEPGEYSRQFIAENLSSGVYFVSLKEGNLTSVSKLILLK